MAKFVNVLSVDGEKIAINLSHVICVSSNNEGGWDLILTNGGEVALSKEQGDKFLTAASK